MLRDPAPVDRHFAARRRYAHDAPHPKSRATPQTPDPVTDRGLAMSSDPALRDRLLSPRVRSSAESDYDTADVVSKPANDIDTAQIVNMALSLSESRRMASRRNLIRGTPPRLAPVPDGSSASNLRQHLQQQRWSSHVVSPGVASPRRASGVRFGSSRDSEAGLDGQYRYNFSSSTLSRAQKAKETLELMAEYRRLLSALPPLKAPNTSPPRTPSPARAAKRKATTIQPQSREYNPLQYIRNRKVRARERMAISGEKQGFGDVQDVRQWVDRVRQRSPILTADPEDEEDGPLMPPFPGADSPDSQASTQAATSSSASSSRAAARSRRPRVDWFIEPCDMMADAYWLEHDHHKLLIEDRQWRKIYPDTCRPKSSEAMQPVPSSSEAIAESNAPANVTRSTSTKSRAKQKFQKAFPHRHNGSVHGYPHRRHHRPLELKRPRRHSTGEALSGGKDANRGTHTNRTSNAHELMERQMMNMVADEAQDLEMTDLVDDEDSVIVPPVAAHRKSVSMIDSERRGLEGSPSRRARVDPSSSSAERPILIPSTIASDVEFAAVERGTTSGSALSSTSGRHDSPTRNALTKIRNVIQDKNSETGDGADASQDGDRHPRGRKSTSSPDKKWRRPSSPAKLPALEQPSDSSRPNKRSKSMRNRSDNGGVGLRGLFKGPRLDTVFRGGVFRLNGMLWKKDGPVEPSAAEPDSTDESEGERTRGRSRISPPPLPESRPGPRNFLEFMPEFSHAPGAQSRNAGEGRGKETATSSPSRSSRPSSQMEPLKAPLGGGGGIRSASASPSPFVVDVGNSRVADGSDAWDSESYQGSGLGGEVATESDTRPIGDEAQPASSSSSKRQQQRQQQQHWLLADKGRTTGRPSRRDIARIRALLLCSGIKALEMNRRALEAPKTATDVYVGSVPAPAPRDMYLETGRQISAASKSSTQKWQASAAHLASQTSPALHQRIGAVRARLVDDLSELARKAANEADETGQELALGQPLKVKHVVDMMDRILRRRHRRLRWLRRALWLMVEWLLVGLMWYVWAVVMLLRVSSGVGMAVWRGLRWLFWL